MNRPLDELTSIAEADVHRSDRLAGHLRRTPDGVEFRYAPDFLADATIPIATTLPLDPAPVVTGRPGAVPPFFAGLLPEGRRLSGLRRAVKTSMDDELSLLLAVGGDTVGDVRVVPAGDEPTDVAPLVEVRRDWSEIRINELLRESSVVDPVGLAGVQDKASARMISVPVRRAGERFIVKVDPPEFPHVVENEAFFVGVARDAGLATVDARLVRDADDRPVLVVRRFDRVPTSDGGVASLGCEDACQVAGRWPEAKYRLSAEEIVTGLADQCSARPVALADLLRQFLVAWLIGNGDTHAKNFSILRDPSGEWWTAPAYDIVSTAVYGDLSVAVPIGGRTRGLSRRAFEDFGLRIGLNERAVRRIIDDTLDRTADLVDRVRSHDWSYPDGTVRSWTKELTFRRRQLGAT